MILFFINFSATGGRQDRGDGPGPRHHFPRIRDAPPRSAGDRAPLLGAGVQGAVPGVGRQAKQPQRHVVAEGETGE